MNCKQGDMAIILRSVRSNEGMIVECVRYHPEVFGVEHVWEIGKKSPTGRNYIVPDKDLKPIRGTYGKDETLKWKDVPSLEKTS